jgi:hypothetical protein
MGMLPLAEFVPVLKFVVILEQITEETQDGFRLRSPITTYVQFRHRNHDPFVFLPEPGRQTSVTPGYREIPDVFQVFAWHLSSPTVRIRSSVSQYRSLPLNDPQVIKNSSISISPILIFGSAKYCGKRVEPPNLSAAEILESPVIPQP